jgi:hypothetical protein
LQSFAMIHGRSAILGRPVKPGDDDFDDAAASKL